MTATETATEVVADVAEEIADHAQHIADVSRGLSGRSVALTVGAFLFGAGVGGGLAYIFANRRLKTKYEAISDEAIAEMRAHYASKARALDAKERKRPIEEIVAEKGYSSPERDITQPPMAVQPPATVIEVEESDDAEMSEDAVEGPGGVKPQTRNVFEEHAKAANHEWNLEKELRHRSPDRPYVIHYDERHDFEYQDMTLTLYEKDNVVCNERDEVYDENEREKFLGEANLDRFGHGSGSPEIVYIRNDELEMIYEVIKSPNSYAEEVHGLEHTDTFRGNLERMRTRERDVRDDE